MADDNNDSQVGGGSSFGVITEKGATIDEGDKPVLAVDKIKTEEITEGEPEVSTEESEKEVVTEDKTEGTTETDKKGEEPELTEKGTKLDPNPASAVHQELANERKIRNDYEKVLASPELLAKFAKEQYGIDIPVKAGEQTATQVTAEALKEFKAEDFESLDDVAKVVNGLQRDNSAEREKARQEIAELKQTVNGLLQDGKGAKTSSVINHDIGELQKLPELDKTSPDYIEGLEEDIVNEYHRLDLDPRTGFYKGEHSLSDIGKKFVEIANRARKAGSLKAQTIVKDKSEGKVRTGAKEEGEADTSTLSPSDSIAVGISKAFGRR